MSNVKNIVKQPLNREEVIELQQLKRPEQCSDIQPPNEPRSGVFQKCIRQLLWSQMSTMQKIAFTIFLIGSVTVILNLDSGHSEVTINDTVATEKTVFIKEAKICEEEPINMCCHRECQEQANQLQNGIDSESCIDINKLFDKNNQRSNGFLRSAEDKLDHQFKDVLNAVDLTYPDFVRQLDMDYYHCKVFDPSETCLHRIKMDYPIVLLYLYTKKYLTPGIIQKLQKIFNQIREELIKHIEGEYLIPKYESNKYLRNVKLFVGMVDIFDGEFIVDLVTDLKINFKKNKTSPDSLNRQMEQFLFSRLDQRYDPNIAAHQKGQLAKILKNPFGLVPDYNPDLYRITLPIGLIQENFIGEHLPDTLNYGSIGTLIGRGLAHSFLHFLYQSGIKFARILDLFKCLNQQYQEWADSVTKTHLKPYTFLGCTLTANELVADNLGLYLAFQSNWIYNLKSNAEQTLPGLSQLTPYQLFWVRLATTFRLIPDCSRESSFKIYPESQFRLLVLLHNSAYFKLNFSNDCLKLLYNQTSNSFSDQIEFRQTCKSLFNL